MNWLHLQAFCWLRWRLSVNQWRRGGKLNAVLMTLLAAAALALAVPLAIACFVVGLLVFPEASPAQLMYTWDAVVIGLLFFWSIGVLTELQRSDSLTLSKFMHLPVSVQGAFLINYLSSLVRLTTVVFVPVLAGLGLALVFTRGGAALTVLPATVAFLLMVTAVTYQFQGWLASLMSNPRRRRTVVVLATTAFVLIFQLPNLLNFFGAFGQRPHPHRGVEVTDKLKSNNEGLATGQLDRAEWLRRQEQILDEHRSAAEKAAQQRAMRIGRTATWVNLALPLGWLPLGVLRAAEGNPLPALGGTLGMGLLGSICLWRAYRTTVALYQGQTTARKRSTVPGPNAAAAARPATGGLLTRRLPGVSEPAAAVALASFQSLLRAPESKMMLLTPLILSAIFGAMALRSAGQAADSLRALMGVGAIAMTMFGATQLMANQFGFDRDGFRSYVLCAAPRREILLGKNLAFIPLLAGILAVLLVALQFVSPMRWDHLLAMPLQFVSMFLLFSLTMNLLSIFAPMRIAAGSLNPASPKLVAILLQLAMLFFLVPLTQIPTLLPLAAEAAAEHLGWSAGLPMYLLLSLLECAAVVYLYRTVLNWQGDLLRSREQQILDVVTNR